MVSIPGKSRACPDCKRRRIKCDFTLPCCLRCIKAGIPCQGYQQPTLWVNRTPDQPNVSALSVIADKARLDPDRRHSPCSKWMQILRQLRIELSQPWYQVLKFRLDALRIIQGIYLCQSHAAAVGENGDDLTPSSWIEAVCHMEGPSGCLDHSLLLFCALQVRLSGESGISVDEIGRDYNHALGKVIAALDPWRTGKNDKTLAAIAVLSTCELFVFPTDTSWSAHAQGISEILRHRSVAEPTTPTFRSICLRLCVLCVVQALGERASLSLGPDQWHRLIGPLGPAASFVRLLHIVVEAPAMLQEAHVLVSSGDQNPLAASHCKTLLVEKFQELGTWRSLYQYEAALNHEVLYSSVLSRMDNPADNGHADKLFPFALRFLSMGRASPWLLCSTIMLQILDLAMLLDTAENPTIPGDMGRSSPRPDDMSMQDEADKLARMLCQSIEFCYHTENGTWGPQASVITQWTLRRYFHRRGLARELEWCKGIKNMKGLATLCDVDLMRFGPECE